jgi:hypothetical protein
MRSVYILAIILLPATVFSQSATFRYSNISQAGIIHGGSQESWQIQTINGVGWKDYSLGIGVGYDPYHFKSVALFADLRKKIFDVDRSPFVYLDLGTNLPAKKKQVEPWQTIRYSGGAYADAGLGYSWKMQKGGNFIVSLGYSEKKITERYHSAWNPDDQDEFKTVYHFRRLALKIGLSF